jgi:hypothetical protein
MLSKHPDETPKNKKMLDSIIDRWARYIHKKPASYAEIPREERFPCFFSLFISHP